ncbi:CaiB/BaiF CoA-transferase family protein [Brevundimonas vesicularis]|uniref:CaiB/BaiF CoA-transferase family protein n=1 Tax=Brevundimonas vesicularis TaxID=41276 RepID=UPI0008371EBD|nr:CoA transferase [Brevundimonas vesicularis]
MSVASGTDRPLRGVRVVDLVRGHLAPITRYLADLGARVDRIEAEAPAPDDLSDLAANSGKRRVVAALDDPEVRALIAQADVVVADAGQTLNLTDLRKANPSLVTMTVSDFGVGNSFSDWQATDLVLHALSGGLSRSGIRGRAPLPPPGRLALECAVAQAAYALGVSLYRALRTGEGDHIDFAALEGAVQALDPGFGISGSATMGKPLHLLSRDRPPKGFQYPILPCADGHVRICLLSKRQWRAMFRWMGEPPQFAAPEFDSLAARYKSPDLLKAIAAFFADRTRAELEAEGQGYGVPISMVLTLEEGLNSEHVKARGALRRQTLPDGRVVSLPNGVVAIDGERMTADESLETQPDFEVSPPSPAAEPGRHAFEGLRVLDLGVIVVGAEQGRLLADQGADVVKVESRAYPDGNRQSYLTYGLSVSFAAGHRNKRSLGLNLRDPAGRRLFLDLASRADVILSNFKPGTLEGLGLDYQTVSQVNPRVVMVDSSAFGASGPWSGRMGYGPLVRAATGLTLAWRYPDDPEGFSDSTTIYPDHVAARVGALATVALLIRRLRTGRGGTASIAQSEIMLAHFAEEIAQSSVGEDYGAQTDWPCGVYQTQGDDDWCVVTVRNTADWMATCRLIGFEAGKELDTSAKRLAAREQIDAAMRAWFGARSADQAAVALQAVSVPAARMLRVADLQAFPWFQERRFYRVESHPYLGEPVVAERRHARTEALAEAPLRCAPLAGEHSETIVREWLSESDDVIAGHIATGVLEPVEPGVLAAATAAIAEQAQKGVA